jgi:hypothetical protein
MSVTVDGTWELEGWAEEGARVAEEEGMDAAVLRAPWGCCC